MHIWISYQSKHTGIRPSPGFEIFFKHTILRRLVFLRVEHDARDRVNTKNKQQNAARDAVKGSPWVYVAPSVHLSISFWAVNSSSSYNPIASPELEPDKANHSRGVVKYKIWILKDLTSFGVFRGPHQSQSWIEVFLQVPKISCCGEGPNFCLTNYAFWDIDFKDGY